MHAWTVGAVGLVTLGVMSRATRGHTGHALAASPMTVSIYGAMIAAALSRIAAGFFPQAYMVLLELAGNGLDRSLCSLPRRICPHAARAAAGARFGEMSGRCDTMR